jgi:hypothetical protein
MRRFPVCPSPITSHGSPHFWTAASLLHLASIATVYIGGWDQAFKPTAQFLPIAMDNLKKQKLSDTMTVLPV